MSIPLREFGKTGVIISAFDGSCLPVRHGSSLHKSQTCYPFYLTTQAKNEFVLYISVEKDRGY
jgi:hypothetical protein